MILLELKMAFAQLCSESQVCSRYEALKWWYFVFLMGMIWFLFVSYGWELADSLEHNFAETESFGLRWFFKLKRTVAFLCYSFKQPLCCLPEHLCYEFYWWESQDELSTVTFVVLKVLQSAQCSDSRNDFVRLGAFEQMDEKLKQVKRYWCFV